MNISDIIIIKIIRTLRFVIKFCAIVWIWHILLFFYWCGKLLNNVCEIVGSKVQTRQRSLIKVLFLFKLSIWWRIMCFGCWPNIHNNKEREGASIVLQLRLDKKTIPWINEGTLLLIGDDDDERNNLLFIVNQSCKSILFYCCCYYKKLVKINIKNSFICLRKIVKKTAMKTKINEQ